MRMTNIHSVFRCLLLIISGFRCFGELCYFYELVSKGYISVLILSTNNAPNFEKVGTYWFRLVRMYVWGIEISS